MVATTPKGLPDNEARLLEAFNNVVRTDIIIIFFIFKYLSYKKKVEDKDDLDKIKKIEIFFPISTIRILLCHHLRKQL